MSKIICDVCGTSYPEVATQCPICGCVRSAEAQSVAVDTGETAVSSTYQHVKGGRFSKSNVRKRAAVSQSMLVDDNHIDELPEKKKTAKNHSNTGLIITIFVLLLAILLVAGYIFIKFFLPESSDQDSQNSDIAVSDEIANEVLCEKIKLASDMIVFEEIGQQKSLKVTLSPINTSQEVTYFSDNTDVITVESNGVLTAVGVGQAVVTVSCGSVETECGVTVSVPLVLDTESVSFEEIGETESIYSGVIPVDDINWSSDDENVATVNDGIVTAVGSGETSIYANYNDISVICHVVCNIPDPTDPTDPIETEPPTEMPSGVYRLLNIFGSSSDVTLKVGERFELDLVDAFGREISGVSWSIQNGSSCTVNDGKVEAVSTGYAEVVATYDGQTFICIVRVR